MVSKSYHIFVIYRSVLAPERDAINNDGVHGKQIISHIYQFLNLTEMPLLMMQDMVNKLYHIFMTY